MNTLGGNTRKIVSKEESWSICEGFDCNAPVSVGTIVKFAGEGLVAPIAAAADVPFGIITSGCNEANQPVTIQSQYNAIVRGKATAAITAGQELAAGGVATVSGQTLTNYAPVAAGQYIAAHALGDAANGEDVWVGVMRVFVKKA